jgi:hypothetical protein
VLRGSTVEFVIIQVGRHEILCNTHEKAWWIKYFVHYFLEIIISVACFTLKNRLRVSSARRFCANLRTAVLLRLAFCAASESPHHRRHYVHQLDFPTSDCLLLMNAVRDICSILHLVPRLSNLQFVGPLVGSRIHDWTLGEK